MVFDDLSLDPVALPVSYALSSTCRSLRRTEGDPTRLSLVQRKESMLDVVSNMELSPKNRETRSAMVLRVWDPESGKNRHAMRDENGWRSNTDGTQNRKRLTRTEKRISEASVIHR